MTSFVPVSYIADTEERELGNGFTKGSKVERIESLYVYFFRVSLSHRGSVSLLCRIEIIQGAKWE